MSSPHFTLFSHALGPNPWKCHMILDILELSFEVKMIDVYSGESRQESYTKYNPNGRVPALIDHRNNDFVIWESGAIVLYLIEKYDTSHKISFEGFEDKMLAIQWLMFQVSGQGPYWGQLVWFKVRHPEKIPSAVERYRNELKRCLGVMSTALEGKTYFVGEKLSFADISFLPWLWVIDNPVFADDTGDWKKDYPVLGAWYERTMSNEHIANAFNARKKFAEQAT